MNRLVGLFTVQAHRRAVFVLFWIAIFAAIFVGLGAFATYQVGENMRAGAVTTLGQTLRQSENLLAAFDALDAQVTAEPCGVSFEAQLRKVAYLPDGLNAFFYSPGGIVQCSTSMGRLPKPVNLGKPDIESTDPRGVTMWFDRGLAFVGLEGLTGTIAVRGAFGVVVPPSSSPEIGWMRQEIVWRSGEGGWFHRAGSSGIYEHVRGTQGGLFPIENGAFHQLVCDDQGIVCVAAEAEVAGLFILGIKFVLIILVVVALISAGLASRLGGVMRRYWSFEARFRRNFSAKGVVCLYQPIIAVATDEVIGCEVLARWRDIDGSIATPDKFLPIVERHQLTMQLTNFVVQRAAKELSSLSLNRRIQVFINIFPRDFDSSRLVEALSPFDIVRDRFSLVVELVEDDQVRIETAQREIEALRDAGIKTFIDDFGTGYSSIANLAALSVDGVKLDRAFAMAPDGSLMARLLNNIIDMIHDSGRKIVIEGVETAERLQMVSASGLVDYAQGYFISRPLEVGQLAEFLATPRGATRSAAPPNPPVMDDLALALGRVDVGHHRVVSGAIQPEGGLAVPGEPNRTRSLA